MSSFLLRSNTVAFAEPDPTFEEAGHSLPCTPASSAVHCLTAAVFATVPLGRVMTTFVAPLRLPLGAAPGSVALRLAFTPIDLPAFVLLSLTPATWLNCGLATATPATASTRTPARAPMKCFLRTYASCFGGMQW